jgi:hypothetical protein
MAKRSATTPLESPKPGKKLAVSSAELTKLDADFRAAMKDATARQEKPLVLDLEELDADFRRLVREAVAGALVPDSRQPIVLELDDADAGVGVQYAYTPASAEVGEFLLQALELLSWRAPLRHYELTELIDDPASECAETAFRGLMDGRIKSRADLGRFRLVLTADEDPDEEDRDLFVQRTTLHYGLYHQKCMYDSAHDVSSSSSDDESSSEEGV